MIKCEIFFSNLIHLSRGQSLGMAKIWLGDTAVWKSQLMHGLKSMRWVKVATCQFRPILGGFILQDTLFFYFFANAY